MSDLYEFQVVAIAEFLDVLEGLENTKCDSYVQNGSITLSCHGEDPYVELYWDAASECWRVKTLGPV